MLKLFLQRGPPGLTRSSLRLASTKTKPLEYKGRIAKPKSAEEATPIEAAQEAPNKAPLGPGEKQKPEKPAEIKQLAAFMARAEREDYQKRYKSFSSKVIRAVVAAPIAIVMSYYLYQRVFLGQERKRLTLVTNVDDAEDDEE